MFFQVPVGLPCHGAPQQTFTQAISTEIQMAYTNAFKIVAFILQSSLTSGQPSPFQGLTSTYMLAKHKSLICTGPLPSLLNAPLPDLEGKNPAAHSLLHSKNQPPTLFLL